MTHDLGTILFMFVCWFICLFVCLLVINFEPFQIEHVGSL